MPRWLLVLALVGCGRLGFDPIPDDGSAPSAQGWALVQVASTMGNGGGSATVTVGRLGAHHLVVVAVQATNSGLVTAIADSSGCNTYAGVATAHATNLELEDDLEIFYAKDSCPDADAISVAVTSMVAAVVVWEVSGIRTDDPLDVAAALDDQPMTSTPLGPTIATRSDGEFVVSAAMVEHNVSAVHAGNEFTNDKITNGNGWAHLTDPHAAAGVHEAQWDQPQPGRYCATAAAFRTGP